MSWALDPAIDVARRLFTGGSEVEDVPRARPACSSSHQIPSNTRNDRVSPESDAKRARAATAMETINLIEGMGMIPRGEKKKVIQEAASFFGFSLSAMYNAVKMRQERGNDDRKKGQGRKRKFTDEHVGWIEQLHLQHGCTLSMDDITDRFKQEYNFGSKGSIVRVMTSTLWKKRRLRSKPLLNEVHKQKRLDFAKKYGKDLWVAHIDVDEKYFQSWAPSTIRIPKRCATPVKGLISKSNVPKVMIVCAVGRPNPRFPECTGKVGVWRVCDVVPAVRNKKDVAKRQMHAQDRTMDRDWFVECLREKVVPAARKMYFFANVITIQLDNARPHGNSEFLKSLEDELNAGRRPSPIIQFLLQPPMSPDVNACDIGVFRSMHSEVRKIRACSLIPRENSDPGNPDNEENSGNEEISGNEENVWHVPDDDETDSEEEVPASSAALEEEREPEEPPRKIVCGFKYARSKCALCPTGSENSGEKRTSGEMVSCFVTRTAYHLDCLDARGEVVQDGARMREKTKWACFDCRRFGCRFPKRHADTCVRCGKVRCASCDKAKRPEKGAPRYVSDQRMSFFCLH